jgi:hypothetical protein
MLNTSQVKVPIVGNRRKPLMFTLLALQTLPATFEEIATGLKLTDFRVYIRVPEPCFYPRG